MSPKMPAAPSVFRGLDETPEDFGPCALTIGNFDGVHAGHRRILRRVRAVARAHGWKAAVLTFDPHPTRVVAPSRAPALMTTPEERCALMGEEGIQEVLVLPFDREVAALSPEEFVRGILAGRLQARAVLVGDNFRFGHRQAGNTQVLAELGRQYGFTTEIVPAVTLRGQPVSSTAVRQLVRAGKVTRAARLLERPFALEGAVVAGRGIGSKQTVPTLNLEPDSEVLPATGVYVTRTYDSEQDRAWESITNVGFRPTFGGDRLTVETFLLAPLEGETPRRIRVEFHWRVRDERKFESAEALKRQIFADVARARAYFRHLRSLSRCPV